MGVNRQMCIYHQMRLVKWDLKYRRLDEETTAFLKEMLSIHKGIYVASRGGDENIRLAEADRLDAELAALMGRRWEDKGGDIERYRKRYRRESRFLTVCLRVPGVPPDNNPVERSNRKAVATRSDGGGNRSGKGMEANSILFTNMVTDWLAGRSFFDHMCWRPPATGRRALQPDGNRKSRKAGGGCARLVTLPCACGRLPISLQNPKQLQNVGQSLAFGRFSNPKQTQTDTENGPGRQYG